MYFLIFRNHLYSRWTWSDCTSVVFPGLGGGPPTAGPGTHAKYTCSDTHIHTHRLGWECAFKYSCLDMHLPASHLPVVPLPVLWTHLLHSSYAPPVTHLSNSPPTFNTNTHTKPFCTVFWEKVGLAVGCTDMWMLKCIKHLSLWNIFALYFQSCRAYSATQWSLCITAAAPPGTPLFNYSGL